ncbi:MAG: type III-B CRISPR module-associated Cmr3 family protein, partial [Candidatus Korarchaeota archaeon]|nr:type III-B CRISPR module-associated Cmr3 family protein [Candidatus Korarchaeota archaeon]
SLFEELKGDILDRRRSILEKMPKFVPVILKVDSRELIEADELEGTVYLPAPPLIGGGEPMLPVVREDDKFVFLKPSVTGKWMPVRELLTLLERIKIEDVNERHQMDSDGEGWKLLDDLIDPESALATSYSVGLKIDPERGTAETGMLYRIRTVSPKIDLGGSSFQLGFLAIGGDEGWEPSKWVFLGGERRVAKVVRVDSDVEGLDRALITDERKEVKILP